MRESLDRLSPALVSSDLSVTRSRGDADYVAALGYASMTYPIASPLIRLYLSNDRASILEAKSHACDMARKAARKRGVSLRRSDLSEIAIFALDYVASKVCPRCHGTKFEVIPGTSRLGTNPCKACGGDGRKKMPAKHRNIVIEVVSKIERIESILDSIVSHRV